MKLPFGGPISTGITYDTFSEQISYDLPTDFLNGQSRTRTKGIKRS